MEITILTITVFFTQFVFIFLRTWNVGAIAQSKLMQVITSGAFIHLVWLVSITISVESVSQIARTQDLKYLPVIIGSLVGGVLGSVVALKRKEIYKFFKK